MTRGPTNDDRRPTTDRRDAAMIPYRSAFDARRSQRLDRAVLMTYQQGGIVLNIGDEVHWTHTSQRRRALSMVRRENTIEAIDGAVATVRTAGKRRVQIDEFVEGMREASRR
jgi:hypothetical protein